MVFHGWGCRERLHQSCRCRALSSACIFLIAVQGQRKPMSVDLFWRLVAFQSTLYTLLAWLHQNQQSCNSTLWKAECCQALNRHAPDVVAQWSCGWRKYRLLFLSTSEVSDWVKGESQGSSTAVVGFHRTCTPLSVPLNCATWTNQRLSKCFHDYSFEAAPVQILTCVFVKRPCVFRLNWTLYIFQPTQQATFIIQMLLSASQFIGPYYAHRDD